MFPFFTPKKPIMRTLFVFSIILLEAACWRSFTPDKTSTLQQSGSDTILIAAYTAPFVLDQTKEMFKANLVLPANFRFDVQKKYILKIDAVLPFVLPEGVYEAYLSVGKSNQMGAALPLEADLLGLIDLYGLDPNAPTPMSWDVTENLSKKFSNPSTPITTLQFSVFFQGNQMPDGSPVSHQGKLELKKVSLLEIK